MGTRTPRILAIALLPLGARAGTVSEPLGLAAALALAREGAPILRACYLVPEEPELGLRLGARESTGGESTLDRAIQLAQRVEIAAKRRKRIRRDGSLLDARHAEFAAFERDYLVAVADAYLEAAAASERSHLAARGEALGADTFSAARARFEAGTALVLELDLAEVELGRLREARARAAGEAAASAAELAYLLGLGPEGIGAVGLVEDAVGELRRLAWPDTGPETGDAPPARERPEVAAARSRVAAGHVEVALRRAGRVPDLVLSVGREREEATEHLTTFARRATP